MLVKIRDKARMLKMIEVLLDELVDHDYMKVGKDMNVNNKGIPDISFYIVMPDYTEEPTKQ